MKKFLKYLLYTFLGLLTIFIALLFIGYITDFPVNGVTSSAKSAIERMNLGKNITVEDAIVELAGVDGEVIWERENNNYFVYIFHGKEVDIIEFTLNPSTNRIFLTGFHSSSKEKKCKGYEQANRCIHNALKTY